MNDILYISIAVILFISLVTTTFIVFIRQAKENFDYFFAIPLILLIILVSAFWPVALSFGALLAMCFFIARYIAKRMK